MCCIDWDETIRKIKAEKVFLMNGRLTSESLEERRQAGMMSYRMHTENNSAACMAVVWHTGVDGLVEVGTFWVDSEFRGHGWGTKMFHECCHVIQDKDLRAIMFTDDERMFKIAKRFGWTMDSQGQNDVIRWILTCSVCTNQCNSKICSCRKQTDRRILFRSW